MYQEDDADIQAECDHSIGKQGEVPNSSNIGQVERGDLEEEGDDAVHDRTYGSEIVE